MSSVYFGMAGIEDLLQELLDFGEWIPNERTGTKTKAMFDGKVVIPSGEFPFVTNLPANPRLAFEEMWFFLNGKTNTKELEEKGIMFWNGNTNREFLDSNGLEYLDEGELGCAYSEQIRNFGGYDEIYAQDYGSPNPVKQGKDQLKELFDNLGKDKYSRRHVITLWNPQENEFGVLTPCWHTYQFVVIPENGIDTLHLKLINRSLDTLFGARFAIQQYRLLQMALCKAFDFELGYLSCDLTHIHLYENQIEYTKELLLREYAGGDNSIELTKEINSLDDLLSLQWTDFKVEYTYNNEKFTQPRPKMVA